MKITGTTKLAFLVALNKTKRLVLSCLFTASALSVAYLIGFEESSFATLKPHLIGGGRTMFWVIVGCFIGDFVISYYEFKHVMKGDWDFKDSNGKEYKVPSTIIRGDESKIEVRVDGVLTEFNYGESEKMKEFVIANQGKKVDVTFKTRVTK
jgi:hypothetical protein